MPDKKEETKICCWRFPCQTTTVGGDEGDDSGGGLIEIQTTADKQVSQERYKIHKKCAEAESQTKCGGTLPNDEKLPESECAVCSEKSRVSWFQGGQSCSEVTPDGATGPGKSMPDRTWTKKTCCWRFKCSAIECVPNEKVVNHECVKCPAGKTSQGNKDASGADTTCAATLCGPNEKVVDHVCVACPAGDGSTGGHDASGVDTPCRSEALLVISNQAKNGIKIMSQKDCELKGPVGQDGKLTLTLSGPNNKFWVHPDGCKDCGGDCNHCPECFYIAGEVTAEGVLVAHVGYGSNEPVQVHDNIAKAILAATNQLQQPESVECSTDACTHEGMQATADAVLTISGDE